MERISDWPNLVYQKLPESTIRLLILLPGTKDLDLNAEFRLQRVSRKLPSGQYEDQGPEPDSSSHLTSGNAVDELEQVPYEALSYTWGKPIFRRTIHVHGSPIPITQNLFDALVHIRNEEARRILWVDALCINQSDNHEKSFQIPLMRHIYTNASQVLIWLGRGNKSSDRALQLINDITVQAKIIAREKAIPVMRFMTESGLQEELWDRLPSSDNGSMLYLEEPEVQLSRFIERPWFSRLWTMQEAAVAKVVTVVVGKKLLN